MATKRQNRSVSPSRTREHAQIIDAIRRTDGETASRIMGDRVTVQGTGVVDLFAVLSAQQTQAAEV